MSAITVQQIGAEEIYTMPEGNFAFGLMLYVRRTKRVTFNFVDAAGNPTDTIKCEWDEFQGRYRQRE